MFTLVYIHGASATSESFTHIREHLGGNDIVLDYNSHDGFKHNLEQMTKKLESAEKIFFIAHSLGGIYALHLANIYPEKTVGGVTLSTPYGGSTEADYARYFLPFNRLMRDITPRSEYMYKINELTLPDNWTNVVTTKGSSPWIYEDNDGIVTIKSMKHRKDMEFVEIDLNHYEVIISNRVVDTIRERINRV
jgi:pimeloyl-ACP methyl ester carboxylesterase